MSSTPHTDDTAPTTTDDTPPKYRIKDKLTIEFRGENPSPPQGRALLEAMAVERIEPAVYNVTDSTDTYEVDTTDETCTCSAGQKQDQYTCRHEWHIRYRRESGTIEVPDDWEDPVETRAKRSEKIAEAARARRPEPVDVECASCETETTIEVRPSVDTSAVICEDCPPVHPEVVHLNRPGDEENGLVRIRGIVEDDLASSFYPGEETVMSLADLYGKVEGVTDQDTVVRVAPRAAPEADYTVFTAETETVPQGALRNIQDASED